MIRNFVTLMWRNIAHCFYMAHCLSTPTIPIRRNVAVIIDRDSLKESFNTIDELLVGINNRMITEDPNALIPAVFSVLERYVL